MAISSTTNSYLEGVTVLTEKGEWKVWRNGQLADLPGAPKPNQPVATALSATNPLHPNPLILKKDTAAFYFFPEDEEDVLKLKLPEAGQLSEYSLTKIIQKILAHYNLNLQATAALNLKNIVYVFLKGTRSPVATWELLQAPFAAGGLNLETSLADNILGFIKELKVKINEAAGAVLDDWGKVQAPAKPIEPVKPIQPQPMPAVTPVIKPVEPVKAAEPINKNPSVASFRKPLVWQDQKVGDVRRSYKLVSPLEELALMNLEMFRKMGDQVTAAKKIREKIAVLGEQSIAQGSQAILAWRKSPLNQMYVKIGQLSLESGQHVAEAIEQLTNQGEKVLTLAEFEVISDLNQALRA